jgi:receptor protein-tyrosine kinase
MLPLYLPAPSPLLPFDNSDSQADEQYRIARTKICHHPKSPRVLAISSAAPQDGKSVTAINLAGALSLKVETRVLLVDADFRRASVHKVLGVPRAPGLSDVLRGTCELQQAIVRTEQLPNLYVLAAGTTVETPVELLDSARWSNLCGIFREAFFHTVIDSPPFASVADYDLIESNSDGVVIVVRPDHTNRQLCRKVLETVPKEKLLGVIVNCIPKWFLGKFASPANYYYYSSASGYRDDD